MPMPASSACPGRGKGQVPRGPRLALRLPAVVWGGLPRERHEDLLRQRRLPRATSPEHQQPWWQAGGEDVVEVLPIGLAAN